MCCFGFCFFKKKVRTKDDQINTLTTENQMLKTRIRSYENDQMRDIRHRPSKKFRKSTLQECKRCKSAVTDDNDVCRYHPEKPICSPMYSKDNPMMLWKCCYQVSKNEPLGCTREERHAIYD